MLQYKIKEKGQRKKKKNQWFQGLKGMVVGWIGKMQDF